MSKIRLETRRNGKISLGLVGGLLALLLLSACGNEPTATTVATTAAPVTTAVVTTSAATTSAPTTTAASTTSAATTAAATTAAPTTSAPTTAIATTVAPTTARPTTAAATTAAPVTTAPATTAAATAATGQPTGVRLTSRTANGEIALEVTEIARNLDTVWAMAWKDGQLWFTERPGRLTRLGGQPQNISGVVEGGEGGLMGLTFDAQGRTYLMYTAANDNRVVRLEADGRQTVLLDGIAKASIHNGGRILFGPDGLLNVSTGDAAQPNNVGQRNGKILKLNVENREVNVFASGLRNTQGLCFAPDGKLYGTEHGPSVGDEINLMGQGFQGGWPAQTGNGVKNYTPTIAPSGCVVYNSPLISGWQGSLLFVNLKDQSLRRLTLDNAGAVTGEEVVVKGQFGRLRDITVAPDGSIYIATSNLDGRGSTGNAGDRILRIAPLARS
jgi:aldose sugar dehydrogenase